MWSMKTPLSDDLTDAEHVSDITADAHHATLLPLSALIPEIA